MKKLILGLIVGLVAGLGTVAVAQTTATSADFCVKDNGKLRLAIDSTCADDEQLLTIAGEQGPPGADGQDGRDGIDGQDGADGQNGANGQDGVDGQDGVSGYEIVTLRPEWGGGGVEREAFVYCPAGKKVLGAGWSRLGAYTDDSGDIDVNSAYTNEPVQGGDGWHFEIAGDFSGPVRTYELSIFCADV